MQATSHQARSLRWPNSSPCFPESRTNPGATAPGPTPRPDAQKASPPMKSSTNMACSHGHHDSNRVLNNTPTDARSARSGVLLRRHTPSTRWGV
ncbi:hypothetical protein ACFX13_046085 [Malus domestica]